MTGAARLRAKIGENAAALKAKLVDLYAMARSGKLSAEERARLEMAVDEIKAKMLERMNGASGVRAPHHKDQEGRP